MTLYLWKFETPFVSFKYTNVNSRPSKGLKERCTKKRQLLQCCCLHKKCSFVDQPFHNVILNGNMRSNLCPKRTRLNPSFGYNEHRFMSRLLHSVYIILNLRILRKENHCSAKFAISRVYCTYINHIVIQNSFGQILVWRP